MPLKALKVGGSLDQLHQGLWCPGTWFTVPGGKLSWKSAVPFEGHSLGGIIPGSEGREPNSLRGERGHKEGLAESRICNL